MGNYVSDGQRRYRCHRNYPAAKCPEPTHISASSGIEDYVVEQFFSAVGEMAATPVVDDGSLAT